MALGIDASAATESGIASPMKKYIETQVRENNQALARLDAIDRTLTSDGLFVSPEQTREAMAAMDDDARALFDEQILYVLNDLILEASEPALQTKITFEKRKDGSVESAEFKAYQEAKREYEQTMTVAGLSLVQAVSLKQDYLDEYSVAERWRARFKELRNHHELKKKRLAQDLALIERLAPYREKVFMHPYLAPAPREDTPSVEELSFLAGTEADTQPKSFNELYLWALQKAALNEEQLTLLPYQKYHERDNGPHVRGTPAHFVYIMGDSAGYSFYAPVNRNRGASYLKYAYPVVLPFMTHVDSLRYSLHLTGEVLLTLGMGTGAGKFEGRPARAEIDSANVNFGGKVLVSNVGPQLPAQWRAGVGSTHAAEPRSAGLQRAPLLLRRPVRRL